MEKFNFVVQSPVGIHARPATVLVETVKHLSSDIYLSYGDKKVNCKSVMGVLSLHVYQGGEVTFIIEGENEKSDAKELYRFCNNNL